MLSFKQSTAESGFSLILCGVGELWSVSQPQGYPRLNLWDWCFILILVLTILVSLQLREGVCGGDT